MSSTREIPNQRQSGRELGERELFSMVQHHLKAAASCMNGLAHSRKDNRYLRMEEFLTEMAHSAHKLSQARSSQDPIRLRSGLIVPAYIPG